MRGRQAVERLTALEAAGAFSDLGLQQRLLGAHEHLDDVLLRGFGDRMAGSRLYCRHFQAIATVAAAARD